MPKFQNTLSNFLSDELKPYFASKNKKPLFVQLKELLNLQLAHRYIPYQYFRHRLYEADAPENYLDYIPPRLMQQFLVKVSPDEFSDIVMDKSKFRRILERHDVPCVREIVRRREDGRLFDADGKQISKKEATELVTPYGPRIFVKDTFGRQGIGATIIDMSSYQDDIFGIPGDVLYQPVIKQHQKLNEVFPHSVNTIRIDSLKVGDEYISNGAVLRVGCKKNVVDNWDAGGIAIGINIENGRLNKIGIQKVKYGGSRYETHPDTGVAFADFQIPFWQDILDVVSKAAETMTPHASLGWDVAATPDGPVIVETNHTWDTLFFQEGCGGLGKTKFGEMVMQEHLS